MKLEAVLFDLDNTLVLFDEKKFFENYAALLSVCFQDVLSPMDFVGRLVASSQVMTNNDGRQTNAAYFMKDFSKGLAIDENEAWQRFQKFYKTGFVKLESLMKPLESTNDVLKEISRLGLKTVIASNPMFPEDVQRLRLAWAGLNDMCFDRITHATNSTFCKPNIRYYLEICEKIGVKPERCLMVGNDPFNDMIASKTGMSTFLTTDARHYSVEVSRELAKNNTLDKPVPDFSGSLQDIIPVIHSFQKTAAIII